MRIYVPTSEYILARLATQLNFSSEAQLQSDLIGLISR